MQEHCQIIPISIVEQHSNKLNRYDQPVFVRSIFSVFTCILDIITIDQANLCHNEGRALDRNCQFRSRKIFRCNYYLPLSHYP